MGNPEESKQDLGPARLALIDLSGRADLRGMEPEAERRFRRLLQ